MAGIKSYGAYVPLYRIGPETAGWGLPIEKAICNFDEDSVTMAVAAAIDCLKGIDRTGVDGVIFASTTPPYMEKQSAAIVAEAADLRTDIFTVDCTGSLRAGTSAVKIALDAVNAGSAKNVLVVAADCRMGPPKGEFERTCGDGAAAFLISDSDVAVSVEDTYSISDQIMDVWRPEGEDFVSSWEDRFVFEEGYFNIMPQAVSGLMKKTNLSPGDFTKAIYYGPNARRHVEMGRRLGFDAKTQVQDAMFGKLGCTGAAFALMLLAAAMEEAKSGDRMMLASYGDGSDVFSLLVTELITRIEPRRGIAGHLAAKRSLPDYYEYLNWRGLVPSEGARRPDVRPPSPSARRREDEWNIRFHGVKCRNCGYKQYPPQRVCSRCHAKDMFEVEKFAHKQAKIFTFSEDYIAGTMDTPLVITIVNFDGGGRALLMMTDRDLASDVAIGAPVELTFRRLHYTGGIRNYYWKTMPIRDNIIVRDGK